MMLNMLLVKYVGNKVDWNKCRGGFIHFEVKN